MQYVLLFKVTLEKASRQDWSAMEKMFHKFTTLVTIVETLKIEVAMRPLKTLASRG